MPLWEKPCQQGIQPSQKPRGNTFKNTSRKHLDASYNLLPDYYSFCHDSPALERLSLPTLQKLVGEGGGYRESGKSVDKMDTSTAKSCSFHMLKKQTNKQKKKKKGKLSRPYQHVILMTEHYAGCCTQFLPGREIKVTGVANPCGRTAEKPQRVFHYSWQGLKDSAYRPWHS